MLPPLAATLVVSTVATAAVYLGAVLPRLQRGGETPVSPWRFFRNLESFRHLSDREGTGLGVWWLAILLTAADLCLGLAVVVLRFSDLVKAWD